MNIFASSRGFERELGEALKVVLRLQNNPAADAIVGMVGDSGRKARVVREAIQTSKNVDGTDQWKSNADELMGKIPLDFGA